MLDAYIIEKIKREQERRESDRVPLHIERVPGGRSPRPTPRDGSDESDRPAERGVVIIEF